MPPHRPLSVVTRIMPAAFAPLFSTMNGWRYSGVAALMCAATSRILSAYGRAARMRSCARRIFDAATISIALVILRVFCTLLILPRISFIPAIAYSIVGQSLRFSAYSGPMQSYRSGAGCFVASESGPRRFKVRPIRGSVSARLLEVLQRGMQCAFVVLRQVFVIFDALDHVGLLGLQVVAQTLFERQHLSDFEIVEVTVVRSKQRDRQLPNLQRLILRLLQQFRHATTAFQLLTRRFVQVRCELRERGQFTILRQVGTNTAGQLLDDLGLRCTADSRHGHACVNSRANTGVEQVGFQE